MCTGGYQYVCMPKTLPHENAQVITQYVHQNDYTLCLCMEKAPIRGTSHQASQNPELTSKEWVLRSFNTQLTPIVFFLCIHLKRGQWEESDHLERWDLVNSWQITFGAEWFGRRKYYHRSCWVGSFGRKLSFGNAHGWNKKCWKHRWYNIEWGYPESGDLGEGSGIGPQGALVHPSLIITKTQAILMQISKSTYSQILLQQLG